MFETFYYVSKLVRKISPTHDFPKFIFLTIKTTNGWADMHNGSYPCKCLMLNWESKVIDDN